MTPAEVAALLERIVRKRRALEKYAQRLAELQDRSQVAGEAATTIDESTRHALQMLRTRVLASAAKKKLERFDAALARAVNGKGGAERLGKFFREWDHPVIDRSMLRDVVEMKQTALLFVQSWLECSRRDPSAVPEWERDADDVIFALQERAGFSMRVGLANLPTRVLENTKHLPPSHGAREIIAHLTGSDGLDAAIRKRPRSRKTKKKPKKQTAGGRTLRRAHNA